ncbi:hypothetical protein D9611_013534 [Ephemerocybe angulata]|uniref:ubiquitinyl hydrolase 1 n=1 Tax=Ephemerocybe angulata TaxID=980116 RepID=A0A8H5FF13_9AGAR|nr:hypothetical protein D9611_013534 [Tulosesus angulatus]
MTTAGLEPATFWCLSQIAVEPSKPNALPLRQVAMEVDGPVRNTTWRRRNAADSFPSVGRLQRLYSSSTSAPMHLPEEFRVWVIELASTDTFQQTAPLIVLILVPTLAFFAAPVIKRRLAAFLAFAATVIMSVGFSLPSWLSWSTPSSSSTSSGSTSKHSRDRKKIKKNVRTRNEQMQMNGIAKGSSRMDYDDAYYPGLVNISGTYCFMNSTLQALASLSYLQPHIDAIHAKAEALDVPTPVVDTLKELLHEELQFFGCRVLYGNTILPLVRETRFGTGVRFQRQWTPGVITRGLPPPLTFQPLTHPFQTLPIYPRVYLSRRAQNDLNTPRSSYTSLRPVDIIEVLTAQTKGRTNSLFYSREHQDAQELFQVVSECLRNEIAAVDKEGARDRGFGAFAQREETTKEIGKSVFDGLTANRRSCVICGYTEAVMHFSFDSWQLSVPRLASSCRLEDCLEDYTRLEILKDCICRKCSVVATLSRLQKEVSTLEEAPKPSSSKKKRLKEVRKMEARVKTALQEGRIEDDLKDVRMEKVFSPASTKQAMIARPPPVLALHLNRSIHYGQYASKNNCRVVFPEVLDLTPYTTSGNLSTVPTAAISTPPPAPPGYARRSTTPTPSLYAQQATRTIYRLSAVVCHFGTHSFGHYVCYRRRPRGVWRPPKLVDPLRFEGDGSASGKEKVGGTGDSKESDEEETQPGPQYVWEDGENKPGTGWLRISDDSVRECGIESVLAEGSAAFMLYYELAVRERAGVYGAFGSASEVGVRGGDGARVGAEASEETLKPEMRAVYLNGSVGSLVSEVGVGVKGGGGVGLSKSLSLSVQQGAHASKERRSEDAGADAVALSSSVPSGSVMFGPRVVRSVAAGRGRSASVQPSGASGSVRASSVGSMPSTAGVTGESSRAVSLAPSSASVSSISVASVSTEGDILVEASSPLAPSSPAKSKATSSPKKSKNKNKNKTSSALSASTPASIPTPTSPISPSPSSVLPPKTPLSATGEPRIPVLAPLPVRPTSPGVVLNGLPATEERGS